MSDSKNIEEATQQSEGNQRLLGLPDRIRSKIRVDVDTGKVRQIFELRDQDWTMQNIANYFEVSKKTILNVLQRNTWAHVCVGGE